MARRRRITPFARFFIFLLIAAPTALIIAMLVRGEELSLDGVKNAITNTSVPLEQHGTYSPQNSEETTTLPIEQQATRQNASETAPATRPSNQQATQSGVQAIEFKALQSYVESLEKRLQQLEKELETIKKAQRTSEQ